MTHFTALVLVPPHTPYGAAFSRVADLVSRYRETDEWGEDGTRYDWFQVGGRSTGLLDNYEPRDDPANFSRCKFCEGTGTTTQAVADEYPAYQKRVGKPCVQCNVGYGGEQKPFPGKALNFGFQPHAADVIPARDVDIERMRYIPGVIVTPDGKWHEQYRLGLFVSHLPPDEIGGEEKTKSEWTPEFCRLLDANRDSTAVVVDFHV